MNARHALPVALTAVVAAGVFTPALAGPPKKPKPISEEYSVTGLPVPYDPFEGCVDPALEGISRTTKTIKPTGAGTLEVTLKGFAGDWDILVFNDKGAVMGIGSGSTTGDPSGLSTDGNEKLVLKTKKGMELQIAVCNFLGGPTAEAKYVFTYK